MDTWYGATIASNCQSQGSTFYRIKRPIAGRPMPMSNIGPGFVSGSRHTANLPT